MAFYVYIVRCSDGSYYVGHTDDIASRISAHNEGRGAKYTFLRRPVTLVYSEIIEGEAEATRRERQIKGWTAPKRKP